MKQIHYEKRFHKYILNYYLWNLFLCVRCIYSKIKFLINLNRLMDGEWWMINDLFNWRINSTYFGQNNRPDLFILLAVKSLLLLYRWCVDFTSRSGCFLSFSRRSLAVDLLHISKCRGVWSNTPRYFTNTCFRRRCPKFAAFRPFRRPALGCETNRPRNETPVVDLIYTPAGIPAFIIYASTDRELLNRNLKNTRRAFGAKRTYRSVCRHLLLPRECNDCDLLEFFSSFSYSFILRRDYVYLSDRRDYILWIWF